MTNEYVYFGGKRIAWRDSSGNIHYYAEDFLGNSRVVMTSAGTVCYDADFYPYGGERVVTDSCDQSFKFTGKERDPETGNDYFGAQFYSSSFGRFLSPDWSARVEPVPYAKLDNPQSLDLYLYVRDNPESVFDPDGHLQHKAAGHQWVMQPCNGIGDGPCTWTKETIVAPPNAPPAGAAQQQNSNTPAPTNPNGTPQPPPTPPPPGASGKPNEWVRVPGTQGRPDKWVPRDPVPSPKGGQPGAGWGEKGGHWDIDNGQGERTRYLPNGTKVDHNNRPIPLSTVEKVGFWTTVGAVTVRVGVAVGRAIAACAESGACEAW